MESQEFKDGIQAHEAGLPKTDNPYVADDKWGRGSYEDWNRGWDYAENYNKNEIEG